MIYYLYPFNSLGSLLSITPFPCPKQTSPSPSPPPTIYAFKVLYPYDAQLPDELTIRPGDVITVEEGDIEEDSLWWLGTNEDGHNGYFYVEFTENEASSLCGILSPSSTSPSPEEEISGPHSVSFKEISYCVVDQPGGELKCIICKNLADNPHQSKCCGHTMCYSCAHKWGERSNSCPQCREFPLEIAVDTRTKRHISSLTVYCTHYRSGCEWKGSFNTVRDHLSEDCLYEEVECENDGCTEQVQRRYLAEHMDRECSMRIVECPCCKVDNLPYHELVNTHYKECPDWPMRCPNHCSTESGNNLRRSTVQDHLEDNCPEQVISCQFAEAGCTVRVKRKELADHIQQSVGEHMTAMMSDYMRLKKDHTELQTDHRDLKKELDVLKDGHYSLMIDHDAVKQAHSALDNHHGVLVIDYQKLKKGHEKLKNDHEILETVHVNLMTDHEKLKNDHKKLKKKHEKLKKDHEKLKEDYSDFDSS